MEFETNSSHDIKRVIFIYNCEEMQAYLQELRLKFARSLDIYAMISMQSVSNDNSGILKDK